MLTAVFPMHTEGADKIKVSSAALDSLVRDCSCYLQGVFHYLWAALLLRLWALK